MGTLDKAALALDADGDRTIRQFIEDERITMTVEPTDHNPDAADEEWARTATHWRCRIRRGRRSFSLTFSQGSAHTAEPEVEDVLDCLASDASGYENARTFEEWCSEYGYDTDSRRAERTYRTVGRQAARLKATLGADAYDALLWHTERL